MARGHTIWTDAQREGARQRALSRWANPIFKEKTVKLLKTQPLCPSCGNTDVANFYTDPKGRRTNAYCKECHKENCKTRWHSKSLIERQASKAPMYGITQDEFIELYNKQDGKCAICGNKPSTKRGLHIDHCHKTDKVRGLLCHGCNTAIGSLQEDPEIFQKAISYLRS
jgi:formate dehydrogenase maturation protein FdhE